MSVTFVLADDRVVSATLMSNTTLDAAKTSRVIQLLQTSADLLDLNHLAKGLLLVDADTVLRH